MPQQTNSISIIMKNPLKYIFVGLSLLQLSTLAMAQNGNSFGIGHFNQSQGSEIVGNWCFTGQVQSSAYYATTDGCMNFEANGTGNQTYCITTSNVGKSCTPSVQYFSWTKSNGQITVTFDAQNVFTYNLSGNGNRITLTKSNEARNLVKGACQASFYPCGTCGGTGQTLLSPSPYGNIYDRCKNCLGAGKLIVHNCQN